MAHSNADTKTEAPVNTVAEKKEFSRDQIRSAILNAPGDTETIDVFGIQVEIRSPKLEELLQYRGAEEDKAIMARAIVNNVYVPGSEQRVFDDADIPELMKTQFSKDMRKLSTAVTRVLGGDEQLLAAVDNDTKSD